MEGLGSFLLFAVLFYLMMRYGCGAHMMHGTAQKKSIDLVCGIAVEPDKGYAKMYNGKEYRFCTTGCLNNFDRDPERYLKNDWKKEGDEGELQ